MIERHPETWIYLGKQINREGKVVDLWIDELGATRAYAKFSAPSVGSLYSVDCERDEGTVTVFPGTLTFVSQSPNVAAYRLENAGRAKEIEAHRLAKSAKREDELAEVLDPVIELAGKLTSRAAKQALIDEIARRIYRA